MVHVQLQPPNKRISSYISLKVQLPNGRPKRRGVFVVTYLAVGRCARWVPLNALHRPDECTVAKRPKRPMKSRCANVTNALKRKRSELKAGFRFNHSNSNHRLNIYGTHALATHLHATRRVRPLSLPFITYIVIITIRRVLVEEFCRQSRFIRRTERSLFRLRAYVCVPARRAFSTFWFARSCVRMCVCVLFCFNGRSLADRIGACVLAACAQVCVYKVCVRCSRLRSVRV